MDQLIITFYKFAKLPDVHEWKTRLQEMGERHAVLGTIILGTEGINATLSGSKEGIGKFMGSLREDARFSEMPDRQSQTERQTFYRLRIVVREEIVTLGAEGVDPTECVGTHVDPEDWNALVDDPEVMLVDTRNDYEVELGTFRGAVNPSTQTFCQWPDFVEKELSASPKRKIAMFCTGGIRCEKASSHLLKSGFDEVFHLRGGILNYLEKINPEESRWEGECFVFHHQVSVVHGLENGSATLCFGCRWPIKQNDLDSSEYEEGVSCPKCNPGLSEQKKVRLRERHRQVNLARKREDAHIGKKMPGMD